MKEAPITEARLERRSLIEFTLLLKKFLVDAITVIVRGGRASMGMT